MTRQAAPRRILRRPLVHRASTRSCRQMEEARQDGSAGAGVTVIAVLHRRCRQSAGSGAAEPTGGRRRGQECTRRVGNQAMEGTRMNRRVSPMFAVIAVVVALAAGALWFMFRYRAHEARVAEHNQMLQQEAERSLMLQEEAGRAGRARVPGTRRSQTRSQGSPGGREGPSSRAPGEGSERGRAPGTGPTGQQNSGGRPGGE